MTLILLVAISSIVTECDQIGAITEAKTLNVRQDTQKTESRKLSNLEKEISAKARNFNPNLENPILKTYSEEVKQRIQFEGGNDLTEGQDKALVAVSRAKRQVLKDKANPNTTWENGVFYTFNTSDQNVRNVFKMGVKVWEDSTCIDFVEDENATDKVIVVKENECWADLGRMGGEQFLSLTWNATVGSAVHEIGHVLGFFHTMCRYDRDNYIKLVKQNINPRVIGDFQKISPNYSDVYGLGYDYGSIMHYDERCDSINGQPTIIATDANYQKTMGSDLISFSDIFVINEHYGCNAICNKSTSAKCANEGFPHPRNCSVCICPSGYGGPLCDKRPPGCGEDLTATNKKQMVNRRLGFGTGVRDHFDFCNYMISAPKGKKIVVELEWVSYGYDRPGCIRGGVEIKSQKDQKLTGYRFCSQLGSGHPIVSSVNPLPVILFNRQGTMQTRFTYRYID